MNGRPVLPRRSGWIRIPDSQSAARSLRRNNPAQRMTPGQYDAAMIDLRRWSARLVEFWGACPFNQGSPASRTPVRGILQLEYGVAIAAHAFHTQEINGSGRSQASPGALRGLPPPKVAGTLNVCTLPFAWWQSTWI